MPYNKFEFFVNLKLKIEIMWADLIIRYYEYRLNKMKRAIEKKIKTIEYAIKEQNEGSDSNEPKKS